MTRCEFLPLKNQNVSARIDRLYHPNVHRGALKITHEERPPGERFSPSLKLYHRLPATLLKSKEKYTGPLSRANRYLLTYLRELQYEYILQFQIPHFVLEHIPRRLHLEEIKRPETNILIAIKRIPSIWNRSVLESKIPIPNETKEGRITTNKRKNTYPRKIIINTPFYSVRPFRAYV